MIKLIEMSFLKARKYHSNEMNLGQDEFRKKLSNWNFLNIMTPKCPRCYKSKILRFDLERFIPFGFNPGNQRFRYSGRLRNHMKSK